eukprot:1159357-Pelagomonas_calceolata.AAC.5
MGCAALMCPQTIRILAGPTPSPLLSNAERGNKVCGWGGVPLILNASFSILLWEKKGKEKNCIAVPAYEGSWEKPALFAAPAPLPANAWYS